MNARRNAIAYLIACSRFMRVLFVNSKNNVSREFLSYLNILSGNTRNSVATKKDCRPRRLRPRRCNFLINIASPRVHNCSSSEVPVTKTILRGS